MYITLNGGSCEKSKIIPIDFENPTFDFLKIECLTFLIKTKISHVNLKDRENFGHKPQILEKYSHIKLKVPNS